jgi:hypothetical protein
MRDFRKEAKEANVPAPYLPFKTFLASLDPFSQGIPPTIDRSLWNQSGLVQGWIMNTYRFFKLIDEDDKPTRLFHQLISKKDDERKVEIANILRIGYPAIMEHDLMTMTPKMLDGLLEKYHVGGETKKKAATFFLQAAKFAGVPLGNFLTEKIRNTSTRRRKGGTKGENGENLVDNGLSSTQGQSQSVTLAGGGAVTLTVSVDVFALGKDDRDFVFGLIDQLQKYKTDHPSQDDEEMQ